MKREKRILKPIGILLTGLGILIGLFRLGMGFYVIALPFFGVEMPNAQTIRAYMWSTEGTLHTIVTGLIGLAMLAGGIICLICGRKKERSHGNET